MYFGDVESEPLQLENVDEIYHKFRSASWGGIWGRDYGGNDVFLRCQCVNLITCQPGKVTLPEVGL
jgi:hypothetical protein